jgi:hypothetical protein
MIHWFMEKLERVKYIPIKNPEFLLMVRYYLLSKDRKKGEEEKSFNMFIHKICKSDSADLHDHPWNYFTLILKGGYWEETPEGVFWRGPGYFTFRKAESLHRLIVKENPCWTLFIHTKKFRDWGFMYKNEWMSKDEYIERGLNIPGWKI